MVVVAVVGIHISVKHVPKTALSGAARILRYVIGS